jgi:2,4-diaminopentanoate dehydrogenase
VGARPVGHRRLAGGDRHPGLELAGLVVHSEAKDGLDAGDLCGLAPTGVVATRDIDTALAIDAEVVAYFATGDDRYREAAGDIARCLLAFRNVVITSLVVSSTSPRPISTSMARVGNTSTQCGGAFKCAAALLGMPFGDNPDSRPPQRALPEAIATSIRKMAEASSVARDLDR